MISSLKAQKTIYGNLSTTSCGLLSERILNPDHGFKASHTFNDKTLVTQVLQRLHTVLVSNQLEISPPLQSISKSLRILNTVGGWAQNYSCVLCILLYLHDIFTIKSPNSTSYSRNAGGSLKSLHEHSNLPFKT